MTPTIAPSPALRRPRRRRRPGYTLIELLVVNLLLSLLVILLAGAWRAFGPLCVQVIARGRIVNEANIAGQAIYQETARPPAGLSLGKVEAVEAAGGWPALQFDYYPTGQAFLAPGTYVVQYAFEPTKDDKNAQGAGVNSDGRLVRLAGDPAAPPLVRSIAVARHVESAVALTLTPDVGEVSRVGFTVSFAYRGSRSQYTFEVHH